MAGVSTGSVIVGLLGCEGAVASQDTSRGHGKKVRQQVPKQVCPQVPTDDRDQTVGGCSYAGAVQAWRIGSYAACEGLRP
jgi:hypothetical protein